MADTRFITLLVFGALVVAMFGIIAWAARRTRTASDFFTAGRSISGVQNGLAIAGDFMSAGTFLGTTGLIYLYGFDGTLILVAAIFSFLPLLFLLAERLRNGGAFTLAEVLSLRFPDPVVRAVTAGTSLVVSLLYLFAQLVGAGILLQALSGLSFSTAVILTGGLMTAYVAFGGMLGATWVMIVKAVILLLVGAAMCAAILSHTDWSFASLVTSAATAHPKGFEFAGPGLLLSSAHPVDILSYGLVYMLGTAGLPHVLIRFFTVKDGTAARRSLGWAMAAMGVFFLMVVILGLGARLLLSGEAATLASGVGGNLVAPILAGVLGGGLETTTGAISIALIAGVSFLTILAVVSGLLISASGAVAHDIFAGVFWRGQSNIEEREARVARLSAVVVGVLATGASIAIGTGFNITFLLGLAFLVAASANLPVLLCALFWRSFNRTGAIVGLSGGVFASLALILASPVVLGAQAYLSLKYPAIISIPLGFALCWLGSTIGRERSDNFDKLLVRTELGTLSQS
ncbi:cation acetate symporter [Rhizobium cauense]|uniref:solute symporter family protein n=1 Tax=Rhizobium cauense TaxID=1166683 RepID=UPI001C6F54F0|nr:cation acetate symporter [Rhizobium cauense]MBW9116436.1 cation acetate symporter [Rhizobium cauense]